MRKRCQTENQRKFLDKRQILPQIKVNFADSRRVHFLAGLIWLAWALYLCQLGFGEDADAWLLNRTASLLRNQHVYDPARSIGNPLYELLLAALGPPAFPGFFSNLLSLFLALVFLYRLRFLFGPEQKTQVYFFRICLMVSPLFTGMATASMEFMPAWCCFLEGLISWKNRQSSNTLVWLGLMAGFRPEWALVPALAYLFSRMVASSNRRIPLSWLLPLPVFLLWAFWMAGKNPLPFDSISGYFRFSVLRVAFLIREAGFVSLIYGWAMVPLLRVPKSAPDFLALACLMLFFCFPYEWAYLFPALFLGLLRHLESYVAAPLRWSLPVFIGISSCFYFFRESTLSFSVPAPALRRMEMAALWTQSQNLQDSGKNLLLFGATYLTHQPENWTAEAGNRIFRHKKGHLVVAENLNSQQIDSCRMAGYRVFAHISEQAQLSGTSPDVWLRPPLPVWVLIP